MSSRSSHHSDSTTEELIREIAVLELEVMHLEQYLLSLYRTAFDKHLASLPSAFMDQASRSTKKCQSGSLWQNDRLQITYQTNPAPHSNNLSVFHDSHADIMNQSHSPESIETKKNCRSCHNKISPAYGLAGSDNSSCPSLPGESHKIGMQNAESGHRKLADLLGASLVDHIPETQDRLSEDIVKCMCAIYCKLASPSLPHTGLSVSSTSSLSSPSTFSPQDLYDNWSPCCNDEAIVDPCLLEGLKEKYGPYSGMLEIPQICVDNDRFNYAATMLQKYRSLIQRLEQVDPRKMKHEEKLAFWINIHNALVMHAYLAYGVHGDHMKSSSSSAKAAYNVGGHSINAYVIQSSILGCCSRRSALWLWTVFLPGTLLGTKNAKHAYAFDQPEPLVHFALCSGAYSDPAVRVYTAKHIFQELQLAKEEFVQASISICKDKITLPKSIYYYAKDASLNLAGLLEMIHDCLPESQQKTVQTFLKSKPEKSIEWLPYNSAFRYIIHRELDKE